MLIVLFEYEHIPLPPYCSLHSCSSDGKMSQQVAAFCWGPINKYTTELATWSRQSWQDAFTLPCFWCATIESSVLLQDRASGSPSDVRETRNVFVSELHSKKWHGNPCCVSGCSKSHCAWWRTVWKRRSAGQLIFKFQIRSDVSGAPSSPSRLLL